MCPYNNRLQKSSTENLPQMICRADKPTNEKQKKKPSTCKMHDFSASFKYHIFFASLFANDWGDLKSDLVN